MTFKYRVLISLVSILLCSLYIFCSSDTSSGGICDSDKDCSSGYYCGEDKTCHKGTKPFIDAGRDASKDTGLDASKDAQSDIVESEDIIDAVGDIIPDIVEDIIEDAEIPDVSGEDAESKDIIEDIYIEDGGTDVSQDVGIKIRLPSVYDEAGGTSTTEQGQKINSVTGWSASPKVDVNGKKIYRSKFNKNKK